jgi:hypothetical protein
MPAAGHMEVANMSVEIVLPSGRFVSFRTITFSDLIRAHNDNPIQMMAGLAVLTGKVDGEILDAEKWMDLPLDDVTPILEYFSGELKNAFRHTKGIA